MTSTIASSGLRGFVSGTLLFASGCLAADHVKHFVATRGATTSVPVVNVEYTNEGTFIDKQRYANGRLGGPRCDWDSIPGAERRGYALTELARGDALASYLHTLAPVRKEQIVYTTLVQLARDRGTTPGKQADEIRDAVGWKWDLVYAKPDTAGR